VVWTAAARWFAGMLANTHAAQAHEIEGNSTVSVVNGIAAVAYAACKATAVKVQLDDYD
jgi:hypothetical protein